MYNESISTLQAGDNESFRSGYSSRNYQGTYNGSQSDLSFTESQGPPPVPPPHSVPLEKLRKRDSTSSFSSEQKPNEFNRTPSPLRNAMDDVLMSLDSMQMRTPMTPSQSPVKGPSTRAGPTPSPTKWDPLQSPVRGLSSPSKMHPLNSSRPAMNKNPSSQSYASAKSGSQLDLEEDDDEIPFDPNSYNKSSFSPSASQNSSSEVSNDSLVSRNNTYRSMSSINTNSLSIMSSSTTPTTMSTMSAASTGSMIRRRNENCYKMDGGHSAYNGHGMHYEKPVELPGQKKIVNSKPSKGSLKLKKSTGFLKSFFSGSTSSTSSNGSDGRPMSSSPEKRRLGRQKSQKSMNEERPTSSMSIRDTFRKVSGKSFTGRSTHSSMDLRSTKSSKSLRAGELPDTAQWIETHQNMQRTNTLSRREKEHRKNRSQVDGIPSVDPIESLSNIGGNETYQGGYTFNDQSLHLQTHEFSGVDAKISAINSWPFMTPSELARRHIVPRFSHPLDQLRAAFVFCSMKLKWEPLVFDDEYEEGVGSLSRVMQTRHANAYEVAHTFKNMCDVLSIPCNVIPGYLKGPGEVWHNPGIPRSNHYWNSVLVDGHWRMVDASLANPSHPTRDIYTKCDKRKPESFYFLTRPCELLFTHVPYNVQDEHIVPTLSHETLIALPVAGPAAFKFNLELKDFSTSLTRMQGLEIAELVMAVPTDVEVFAEVVAGTFPAGSAHLFINTEGQCKKQALSQVFWEGTERFYRIKGLLPPSYTQGALNIYVGARGTQQNISSNPLSLAYSVPMFHDGENPSLNFVVRHPTPHSDLQDIYVNEPQSRDLVCGHSYSFVVKQHPSRGLRANGPQTKVKMAIQSPKGKIIKLNKSLEGSGKSYGTYAGTIKCSDPGIWRGLILADSGNAWSVYAEWLCT